MEVTAAGIDAVGHVSSTVKKQRSMINSCACSRFYVVKGLSLANAVGRSSQLLQLTIPSRNAQSHVSQVILSLTKWTIEISHYNLEGTLICIFH